MGCRRTIGVALGPALPGREGLAPAAARHVVTDAGDVAAGVWADPAVRRCPQGRERGPWCLALRDEERTRGSPCGCRAAAGRAGAGTSRTRAILTERAQEALNAGER
ncbi:hypothetical protein SAV14893_073400 [Streptomyces avermitilis]|uniref:Uncharacterized protein n=1 Tax=Streptomyces avermitilis TaxID=33903 RepID=A0A4D4M8S0_STRAX|nr:hypothetical protein SAV14893_073400 [Streptomyces avermitilis]